MSMGLQDRGARAHDFSSLAPGVPRGTQGTQAPRWLRPIRCLRQGPLAGGLARAIDIEDEEVVPLPIPQPSWLFLFHEGASKQIVEKEGSQGLDRSLVKGGKEAAECRTRRQSVAPEERHERACPGLEPLVKGFQRLLGACRIALRALQQNR